MADEREGAPKPTPGAADESKIQSGGREANAAQPLNAGRDHGGPERYPQVDQTDAVQGAAVQGEARSFDPSADAPTPRDDDGPSGAREGRLGPAGDPVEGKR